MKRISAQTKTTSLIKWYLPVLALPLLLASAALSSHINSIAGAQIIFLHFAAGIFLVHIWGPSVLAAVAVNAAITYTWLSPQDNWFGHTLAESIATALSWYSFGRILRGDPRLNSFKDLFSFLVTSAMLPVSTCLVFYWIIVDKTHINQISELAMEKSVPQFFYIITLVVPLLGLSFNWLVKHRLAIGIKSSFDFKSFDPIMRNSNLAVTEIAASTTFIAVFISCVCLSSSTGAKSLLWPMAVALVAIIRQGVPAAYAFMLAIMLSGVICPVFHDGDYNLNHGYSHINNLSVFCLTILLLGRFSSSHRSEKFQIQKQLQAMIESSSVMIFLMRRDGIIIKLNQAAQAMGFIEGGNLEQQVSQKYIRLDDNNAPLPPDVRPVADAIDSGTDLHNIPVKLQKIDSHEAIDLLVSYQIIHASQASRDEILVMAMDVTNHRQQQQIRADMLEQARLTQKKHSLSLLASGISSSYNNILAIIQGNIDLAKMDPSPDQTEKYLQEARKATVRASDLTKQLLLFTGNNPVNGELQNINDIITNILTEIHNDLSERINLSFRPGDTPQTQLSKDNISILIKQILQNSLESIGHKTGTIDISTSVEQITEDNVSGWSAATLAPEIGKYLSICVCDSGIGTQVHTINQIFDPFFTTKPDATGLGLAMVFGIVKSHNGAIKVDTAPENGFIITILLPITS